MNRTEQNIQDCHLRTMNRLWRALCDALCGLGDCKGTCHLAFRNVDTSDTPTMENVLQHLKDIRMGPPLPPHVV
jgi:hypothetical protein